MEGLQIADLSIVELDESLFEGLANLQQLKLQNIADLDTNAITQSTFSCLTNLKLLEISQIDHEEMQLTNIIGSYPSIETLTLNKDIISWIPGSTLERLPNLIELNLVQSQLSNINARAFCNLPNLLRLDLSRNRITAFLYDTFADIVDRPGAKIDITHNDWIICDCNLFQLQGYLQNEDTSVVFKDAKELFCRTLIGNLKINIATEELCEPDEDACTHCDSDNLINH